MTRNIGLLSREKKNCILLRKVYYKVTEELKMCKVLTKKKADLPKLLATNKKRCQVQTNSQTETINLSATSKL